jgi:hypothetical protein
MGCSALRSARLHICLSDVYILWCTDRSILPALGLELLPPLVGLSVCVGSVEDGVALIWTWRRLARLRRGCLSELLRHNAREESSTERRIIKGK